VTLRQLNATEAEAQLYGRLAGALIYADPPTGQPGVLRHNRRGQNGLWSYGISGDAPLVLLHVRDPEKTEIVRQLIRAHAYWRLKGLTVELVILNEDVSVYRQSLHDQITGLIASGIEAQMLDKPVASLSGTSNKSPGRSRAAAIRGADCPRRRQRNLAEQLERPSALEPFVPALAPPLARPDSTQPVPRAS